MTWKLGALAEVSRGHLLIAYRKAKQYLGLERGDPTLADIVQFELELEARIAALHASFKTPTALLEHLCSRPVEVTIQPKRFRRTLRDPSGERDNSVVRALTRDSWKASKKLYQFTLEARGGTVLPPEAHILGALWALTVGHRMESILSPSVHGNRLNRLRNGKVHIQSMDLFRRYFHQYRRWRTSGIEAARSALTDGADVSLVTFDIKSYYHTIDPSFLTSPHLATVLGIESLNEFETLLTTVLVQYFKFVEASARKDLELPTDIPWGVPIGFPATAILANLLLVPVDRAFERRPEVRHYGRYVDDFMLVLDAKQRIESARDFQSLFREVFDNPEDDHSCLKLPEGFGGRSRLVVQPSKYRIFRLQGRAGLEFLSTLEADFRAISSEGRLAPAPSNVTANSMRKVLTTMQSSRGPSVRLRDADEVSIRRYALSSMVSRADRLSRLLDAQTWHAERQELYRIADFHVIAPQRVLEHLDIAVRLVALALRCRDLLELGGILGKLRKSLGQAVRASNLVLNGTELTASRILSLVEQYVARLVWQSVAANETLVEPELRVRTLDKRVTKPWKLDAMEKSVPVDFFWSDLHDQRVAAVHAGSNLVGRPPGAHHSVATAIAKLDATWKRRVGLLREFSRMLKKKGSIITPDQLLLVRRPPSVEEIFSVINEDDDDYQ